MYVEYMCVITHIDMCISGNAKEVFISMVYMYLIMHVHICINWDITHMRVRLCNLFCRP